MRYKNRVQEKRAGIFIIGDKALSYAIITINIKIYYSSLVFM